MNNEVPRIAMDYFYMSTDDEKASDNPILVMVDEATGEKYARAVGSKRLGDGRDQDWLIKDMSEELRSWGHPGGEGGHIILKSDGEKSIVAVRDALAKFHGGQIVQESAPRGEASPTAPSRRLARPFGSSPSCSRSRWRTRPELS